MVTAIAACESAPFDPIMMEDRAVTEAKKPNGPRGGGSGTVNPISGITLYVDPASNAALQAKLWVDTRSADAAEMEKIASRPQAIWLGDWISDPSRWVHESTQKIRSAGAVPLYVVYNIPHRDCGSYSGGGTSDAASYSRWISGVADGIGSEPAVVILEPDAVAGLDCLSAGDQQSRYEMLANAVKRLKSNGRVTVYVDAGHPRWLSAPEAAGRLLKAGVMEADGFSLNVSNFISTEENVQYGQAISALARGKHFVIDTGRNGVGPTSDSTWCNPDGRALGAAPTARTGVSGVDAFLWIKRPGESDGECNGGPSAGAWWAEYALGLAQRASRSLLASQQVRSPGLL